LRLQGAVNKNRIPCSVYRGMSIVLPDVSVSPRFAETPAPLTREEQTAARTEALQHLAGWDPILAHILDIKVRVLGRRCVSVR
jgi:hypothetical protein